MHEQQRHVCEASFARRARTSSIANEWIQNGLPTNNAATNRECLYYVYLTYSIVCHSNENKKDHMIQMLLLRFGLGDDESNDG